MCGIVGLLNLDGAPVARETIARMCATLVHRGPDDQGIEQPAPWVGLGHRRLSIIDLVSGRQPLCNEDGRVWVTFNGEIFNYRELRQELIERGHRFRTQSDTEVLVHLYEEYGTSCVERLNGQFAFAIWDGERLFCARDPLGIKPLYWYQDGRRFAFASEPRALLQLPGLRIEPDLHGIHLYFRYRFIPAPASAFVGIKKLRAAEWLLVGRNGRTTSRRYWTLDPESAETLGDLDVARRRIRDELAAAVERQLVSDVPVGAFLSGGLDSSTIAALMAQQSAAPIDTFTIGFREPEYDERTYAEAVAKMSGTNHLVEVFGPEEAAPLISELLRHIDEPFGDTSILPTFAVTRLARRRVKVVLSGDGGDELFAGYGRFYRALHLLACPPWLRPFWPVIRRLQRPPRDPSCWHYPDTPRVEALYRDILVRIKEGEAPSFLGPRLRDVDVDEVEDPIHDVFERARALPPLSRLLAVDLNWILSEYHLVKMDRASMQSSLEVRVPFLDKGLVELSFRLSAAVKLHGEQSKGILREAMRDLLPKVVLGRGKKGFSIPFKYWFVGGLTQFAHEHLANARVVSEGFLTQRALDQLLRPGRQKTEGSRLWRVLVLESWLRGLEERRAVSADEPRPAMIAAATKHPREMQTP